jgi:hypothetical protein
VIPVEIQNFHCGCSHRLHRHIGLAFTDKARTEITSGPCAVIGCLCEGVFSQPYPLDEVVPWTTAENENTDKFRMQIFTANMQALL